jgi:thiol-disulfide isomerase/thioredoxin
MNGLEIVFVLIGWIAVGLIVYTVYVNMELRVLVPNIPAGTGIGPPRFVFFYAPWCPWSKKAKPQWDLFEDDLKRFPVTFGGNTVQLEIIDGDTDPDAVKKHHVSAYPTFKLILPDGSDYEMSGHPSPDAFRGFLTKYLGKEEPLKLKPGL